MVVLSAAYLEACLPTTSLTPQRHNDLGNCRSSAQVRAISRRDPDLADPGDARLQHGLRRYATVAQRPVLAYLC